MDIVRFAEKNKDDVNKLISFINKEIDGRVCVTNYLHYLYSLKLFMGEKCKVFVEIGVLWGGSLALVMQTEPRCKFIGIDIFNGYYNKKVPKNDWLNKCSVDITDENHLDFVKNNIDKFNMYDHEYHLIKGSSYDEKTVSEVKTLTDSIDLLFIDGDHTEVGVLGDFMAYKDMVSPGGYILFDNYGQPKAWPEVKVAVDKIDFPSFGFKKIRQLGWSMLVQKNID